MDISHVRRSVTVIADANIKALPTTTIVVVPAQGADRVIIPLFATLSLDWVADYTNINIGSSLSIVYPDYGAALQGLEGGTPAALFAGGEDALAIFSLTEAQAAIRSAFANIPLELELDNAAAGDLTGGDAGNVLTVTVYYITVQL